MRCIERQWIREAMIRQSLVMRGCDTPMKSKSVARNGFTPHRRSVDGTGSGTAKKRYDVRRR